MSLYITRPRRDEVRIGRGLPSGDLLVVSPYWYNIKHGTDKQNETKPKVGNSSRSHVNLKLLCEYCKMEKESNTNLTNCIHVENTISS